MLVYFLDLIHSLPVSGAPVGHTQAHFYMLRTDTASADGGLPPFS